MFSFGIILVRIFPSSNWIRRDISPNAGNTVQNNPECGHFLRSDSYHWMQYILRYRLLSGQDLPIYALKMELLVFEAEAKIINSWKLLIIFVKSFILDEYACDVSFKSLYILAFRPYAGVCSQDKVGKEQFVMHIILEI